MPHEPEQYDDDDMIEVEHAEEVTVINEEPEERRWPFAYPLLWVLVVTSLLLNVVMLRQVMLARSAAQNAVSDAIVVIDGLKDEQFTYNVVIDDTLPLQADLPINETIPVVIDQQIPIRTNVAVPVDAGILGTINLNVPINTTVPINFEQDITIDRTFSVNTTVPVHLDVPIELSVSETPLSGMLDDLELRLENLEAELDQPLVPLPGD